MAHARRSSDGDTETLRKNRSRSNSQTRPMLIAQGSRKDLYNPTPASSPVGPSAMMLSASTGRRDTHMINLESSSDLDTTGFGSDVEDASRVLLTKDRLVTTAPPKISSTNVMDKLKRRLSTSSKGKDGKGDGDSMLVKAAVSALTQQMSNEDYTMPTSIPELTIDSDEKLFTKKNIYFNLRKEMHAQLMIMQETSATQMEAQRKFFSVQLAELRNQHSRTQVLISNVSRNGVYSTTGKEVKELVKPGSEQDYRNKSGKMSCLGCF